MSNPDQDQYEIIIVECCQNCETHQAFSRHSEWKYFQQFNQLKRKIQRFVNNAIVIKNPVPDQLVKSPQLKMNKNAYINKQTNQQVTFPRIGAFEVYIYNVLIYSKLLSNTWPNHYKLVQIINKIIQQKKKGNNLQQFSVYRQQPQVQQKVQKPIKQKDRGTSKKKKNYRVYKSKDNKGIGELTSPVKKPIGFDTLSANKKNRRMLIDQDDTGANRYLESKAQNRVKLPALKKTIDFSKEDREEQQRKEETNLDDGKNNSLKKIFNSIQEFDKDQISFIEKKQSFIGENQYSSLELNESIDNKSLHHKESIRFLEDRSVQYSEREEGKDFMNRSIQFQEEEGFYCDFGLQIDDGTRPKETGIQYVQTQKIKIKEQEEQEQKKRAYMLDEQVQANIIIPKDEKQQEIQTVIHQYDEAHTNTQMIAYINRGNQFPEEEPKKIQKNQFTIIDENFSHLYEKRRNIVDNKFYSVDRFQQKSSKYKWIGRANLTDNIDDLRRKLLIQNLVFSVYNYYGIKTPEKRLSFQKCSNILAQDKLLKNSDIALVHVLSSQNPQIQFPFNFEELDYEEKKYPLSEQLTFRNSKQRIKFTNYGGLLALAYFLNDNQIFNETHTHLGLVVGNQQVKEIYKMNAYNYVIDSEARPSKRRIIINKNIKENNEQALVLERLSQTIQFQFIGMINKLANGQIFEQLLKTIKEIFINMTPSYKSFRNSLLSLKTQKIDEQIVEEFMLMLEYRKKYIELQFKGQIYAYQNYNSLQPKIKFNLDNFMKKDDKKEQFKIDRKFQYEDKVVMNNDVTKHIRSKDHFVVIGGQSGFGKTYFLKEVSENFKVNHFDKLKVWEITTDILTDESLLKKFVDRIMGDFRKQVIIIDNGQNYYMQVVQFVQKLYDKEDPRVRPQLSFCLATSGDTTRFKSRFVAHGIKVINCNIIPFQIEEIRNYLMKSIRFHNYTDKKNLVDELLGIETTPFTDAHPKYKYISFLQNPFYVNAYSHYLSHQEDLDDYKSCLLYSMNKYTLLKEIYGLNWKRHYREIKSMQIPIKQPLHDLRKIAFEYYNNNRQVNQTIREILQKYTSEQIVSNQLCFYPIQIQASIKREKSLFLHNQYFNFFLVEAYSFYMQKGYKNMRMNKLYADKELLALIKEHYTVQRTHSRLLDVVYQTRKYKNTSEQGSNALTLLTKIDYLFTNVNLDQVQVPDADLSSGIFYNCSFRGTNLLNAILYKSQLVNCQIQGAKLDNMNVFEKKIQSQYTVLTAALSNDGRNIALGCGNYLMILHAQTGKQLKKIQAHMDIIRTVKYSRDGTSLITIADDKTLRMWDVRSYRSVVFRLPQKGTIAFSNQTQTIASVSKNNLKVWNIKSMANQYVLQGHTDLITCVNFSLDGNLIVTGSRDTTLKLWSIKKGQLVQTYRGHSTEVITAKISPSKRIIASTSKDSDLIVWDLESRTQIVKKTYPDEVIELAMDEKEKYIVITFSKENYIFVTSINTLETVHTLYGHKSRIISINFDIFYRRLVSLSKDKTVKIWDLDKIMDQQSRIQKNVSKKFKIVPGAITVITFCRFSLRYATGHENGQINIFSAEDNRLVDQIVSHPGAVRCLAFDKLGKIYAGGSDGTLRIWNLSVKRQPKTLQIHSSEMIQLRLNEKSRIIATSSVANELVINDYTAVKIIMSTREQGRVHAIEFSKDEKIMAVGGTQKYVALYEILDGGNTINRMQELGPCADTINCMSFHGDSLLVVALKNGHVAIWNHFKSSLMKKIQNVSPINSLISFQKKYICFASDDGKIRIINMDEGKEVKTFRYPDISNSLAVNTGQNLLYVGTKQGNVIIWNNNSIYPTPEKVVFDRTAIDKQGTKTVHVEGARQIMIRDLGFHEEQYIKINQIQTEIEGVAFHLGKIILLLRNGVHWQVGKKEYHFGKDEEIEGDLFFVRDRALTNFYKTPVRKLKGLKKPIQAILQELSG